MDFSNLRIGYTPFDPAMRHPADRRRFCHYANIRNLRLEIAQPGRDYDVVVVTEAADISVWNRGRRGQQPKVIFELIDSYLAVPRLDPYALFRGIAKFAFGQNRHLMLDYANGLRTMCRRADAVVCSTPEQRKDIDSLCKNVHVVLDFQDNEVLNQKTSYSSGEIFNFVWEGMAQNLDTFSVISDVLESIAKRRRIAIHAVTDLEFGRYLGGRLLKTSTLQYARKISPHFCLYQWNQALFSSIVTSCDLALIPLPLDRPLYYGKPENKLLLMWRMGMPAVVSATPAYSRALQGCGLLDMACRTGQEWENALLHYMNSEDARREAGLSGKRFAMAEYSEQKLIEKWDGVINSLGE
jgi:hypothetical protein